MTTPDELLRVFEEHGWTATDYLKAHSDRFLGTYERFDATWDRSRGVRVLDIGAHWLHLSAVFRLGGYDVIAADVPNTLELSSVKEFAESMEIDLVCYTDLSSRDSLADVASDSVNVVVMAEIIEHLTFNPVELWKEIYRVMAPGARIVLTTPNYYWAGGRAWHWKRFLSGFGGGITTLEILETFTMGPHWKEFSMRELQYYICLLSPDFACVKWEYTSDDVINTSAIQRRFKRLRQALYLEVELAEKTVGIVTEPHW